MRIKMTCFVLCVLCVHTALSQGTIDTSNIRWRLTLKETPTQCSFTVPYSYLRDTNSTWPIEGIMDLQVADPIDGHSNYHLDWANGIVLPGNFWMFSLGLADWNIDRTMIIDGGPASSVGVTVDLWGVRNLYELNSSYPGPYWQVQAYDVPEPSSAALAMLGVVGWYLRRKLGGSAANRASVAEQ
jgi:hypothetical protein